MNLVIIFPGQGSQKIGMGADLYEQSELARNMFAQANKITNSDITNLILHGPENELNQTQNTQPAIALISTILTSILINELKTKGLNFRPIACAGHSLGEFTALWYSRLLTFEELIKIVYIRGTLMQVAPEGGMAAVINMPIETVEKLIKENSDRKTAIANYNCPSQIVISGNKNSILKISEKIKELKGKAIILPVSGAFHSELMKEPSERFNTELEKLHILSKKEPNIPIFQNYDGKASTNPKVINEKIKMQMTSSVLWTQTVTNLVNINVNTVVEVGPGKILTGLIKKINLDLEYYNIYDLKSLEEFILIYEHKSLSIKSEEA